MMFSSIEDAWSKSPRIIEGYGQQPVDSPCDCDELIRKLFACPECVQKVRRMLIQETSLVGLLETQVKRYLHGGKTKDHLLLFLVFLAVVIVIKILFEKQA